MSSDDAKKWVKAMRAELKTYAENSTWTLVPRRIDVRSFGCRWVFAKKCNKHGQVIRYKARLLAKNFKQKFGIDFIEMYSPAAKRSVLTVFLARRYMTKQLDADRAFWNSDLKEQVY